MGKVKINKKEKKKNVTKSDGIEIKKNDMITEMFDCG